MFGGDEQVIEALLLGDDGIERVLALERRIPLLEILSKEKRSQLHVKGGGELGLQIAVSSKHVVVLP